MNEIIWILKPKKEDVDYVDIVVKIANHQDVNLSDYEINQIQSVVFSFKDEIGNYLLEHGYSSLMESDLLLEHIVARYSRQ